MDPSLGGVLGTQGVYQSYLGDTEFEKLGGQTVKISTKQPFADLLDLLVEIPIISMSARGEWRTQRGSNLVDQASSTTEQYSIAVFA
jgi:hypothetical protein